MRTEIISLDRNLAIHGSFVLGGGSVDSTMVYYAYTELDDGGYKLIQIPNNDGKSENERSREVILYERDDVKPSYVITYVCEEDKPYVFHFIL